MTDLLQTVFSTGSTTNKLSAGRMRPAGRSLPTSGLTSSGKKQSDTNYVAIEYEPFEHLIFDRLYRHSPIPDGKALNYATLVLVVISF